MRAGRRLLSSGSDVSSIETTLNAIGASLSGHPNNQHHQDKHPEKGLVPSNISPPKSIDDVRSRLAQASAADLEALNRGKDTANSRNHVSSSPSDQGAQHRISSKRKRTGTSGDVDQEVDYMLGGKRYQKSGSRDLMPPPPVPVQQPYAFMTTISNQEMAVQNGHDQTSNVPVTPHLSRSRDLTCQFIDPRSNPSLVPSAAAITGSNISPYSFSPSMQKSPASQQRALPFSVRPPYNGDSDRLTIQKPPSMSFASDKARPATQSYEYGTSEFPFERDGMYSNNNGFSSKLGLSSNARSSGQQSYTSPSSFNPQRRPLGQDIATSPYFSHRRLPDHPPMSFSRNQHSANMHRTDSYSSSTTTLVRSRERDKLTTAPKDFLEAGHGSHYLTNGGAGPFGRSELSRGRLPTADAEASAHRRRANR